MQKNLLRKYKKIKTWVVIYTLFFSGFIFLPVKAQCSESATWLPDVLTQYVCHPDPGMFAEGRIRVIFTITIAVLILLAIAMGLKMALKLIMSGGDDSKTKEAFNGIKAIFLGIASIFIILLAIPIVLNFFGFNFQQMTSGLLICARAPQSAGCYACLNKDLKKGEVDNSTLCALCDKDTTQSIPYPVTTSGSSSVGTIPCTANIK